MDNELMMMKITSFLTWVTKSWNRYRVRDSWIVKRKK